MILSIVIPVYKAEKIVHKLVNQLHEEVSKITSDYEIILVNDASPDNSWQQIAEICANDKNVKGFNLSRNFGQHYAITAGLYHATGEWTVVMDCDLQDRPDQIIKLWTKAQEGFDSIFAQRIERKHNYLKKLSSQLFYRLFSYLTETRQDASVANFGIYHKKVITAILSMGDSIRYFPTMAQWVGFNKYYLSVEHAERGEGKSSYNFRKLCKLAFDNIIAFSDKALRLTVKVGLIISSFSFLTGIYFLICYFTGHIEVAGFASLIISLWFIAGLLIIFLGILGIYIGKTFDNTKQRPCFIIKEKLNYED